MKTSAFNKTTKYIRSKYEYQVWLHISCSKLVELDLYRKLQSFGWNGCEMRKKIVWNYSTMRFWSIYQFNTYSVQCNATQYFGIWLPGVKLKNDIYHLVGVALSAT